MIGTTIRALAFAMPLAAAVMLASPARPDVVARVDAATVLAGAPPAALSAYGFFAGAADRPAPELLPYTLTTPLFSDDADKARFIFLPAGTRMRVNDEGRLQFPVGAAIIKSFSFTDAGVTRTVETRVLLHRADGWVALPYIWRADGSDADLRIAGGRVPITHTGPGGLTQTFSYAVPNRNQCRNCHQHGEALVPIGPRVENINLSATARALVDGADWNGPRMPRWDDASAPLATRARAYLDVNCSHCHNPAGAASNSGFYLEWTRAFSEATGMFKRPVAAGRGSGGRDFVVHPGRADASILLYRMDSADPGIAMPELGRSTIHRGGVQLIRDWIGAMPPQDAPAP